MVLQLKKLEYPSPKDAFAKIVWNWPSCSGEDFFNFVNVFSLFLIYPSLGKGQGPSFEKIWIPSTQGCFLPSLVEIGAVVLKRRFLNFVNVFSLFRNYLPLEKGGAYHLNKLESPLPKDALCQVWLKLAQWFWREDF